MSRVYFVQIIGQRAFNTECIFGGIATLMNSIDNLTIHETEIHLSDNVSTSKDNTLILTYMNNPTHSDAIPSQFQRHRVLIQLSLQKNGMGL